MTVFPEIRFGAFLFRPTVVSTLFLVVGLLMLVGLGLWQLERAKEKQALGDEHLSRINQAPVRLDSVIIKILVVVLTDPCPGT